MPRGSLSHKDAMQGFGFKEGIVVVDKSRVQVFQYPAPKDNPKEQSDPFTAVVWEVTKLDKDLNIIPLQENEQPTRIISRLCKVESGRPSISESGTDQRKLGWFTCGIPPARRIAPMCRS